MKPPNDEHHTDEHEFIAPINPLRRRAPEEQQPPPARPNAAREHLSPARHLAWGLPITVSRPRATPGPAPAPATAAAPPARKISARSIDIAIAGIAAVAASLLINFTGLLDRSAGTPRPAAALQTHTAKPPSTRTHHRARPHPSPRHTTTRPRHATVHATQPRVQTPLPVSSEPAASAPRASAPAQPTAPARPGGALEEFTFERAPHGRS